MQERVLKYFLKAQKLKFKNYNDVDIVNSLYEETNKNNEKLAYSITIKVLDELGYDNSKIVSLIKKSKWKDYKRSAKDLFFDAIELD